MELKFTKNKISFDKELNNLDKLVIKFTKILNKQKTEYVIISGYVAILFGRSRNTEDVDLFIEDKGFSEFEKLWVEIYKAGFDCINGIEAKEAYYDFMKEKSAIRFAQKGEEIPNFELKFPQTKDNIYSMSHKLLVELNTEKLMISEIELQIAFKLYLGSDKDYEDARHLYKVFKEHLDNKLLKDHVKELNVEKKAEEILWKKV